MSPLSFQEKLQMIWEIISSSPLYTIALIIIVFLIYLFATTNNKNKKQSKKAYIFLYIAAFIFFAVQYGGSAAHLVEYAMNQMFIGYYFPNIMLYLLMFIIANVILWKTLFSSNTPKLLKVVNSSVFGILLYLFVLVLSLINQLQLDVFNLEELYNSNQVRSLLELSMMIFVIWVAVLVVYKIIRKYQLRHKSPTPVLEPTALKKYKLVKPTVPKIMVEETTPIKPEKTHTTAEPEPFTLEEYKMLSQLLKEQKQQQTEPAALSELQELYKSIEM